VESRKNWIAEVLVSPGSLPVVNGAITSKEAREIALTPNMHLFLLKKLLTTCLDVTILDLLKKKVAAMLVTATFSSLQK
jgi:hypothetical protein